MRLLFSLAVAAIVVADVASYNSLGPNTPRKPPLDRQDDLGEKLFLTPFLEDGDAEGARAAAALSDDLPDVGNLLSGSSYAGYITVDEENDGHTFFWFVEATEENPADAPVVVWLQGGPGASSMFGLLEIHGPISTVAGEGTDSDEVRAEEREFAWSRKANMLYIDNPLGAGYSYVNNDALRTEIGQVNEDLYEFLQQFFAIFDSYAGNDFYVFGESYAGKWVPEIARFILEKNDEGQEANINLVGVGVGDGFMSPIDTSVVADFLFGLSLVDENERDILLDIEQEMRDNAEAGNWQAATDNWSEEQGRYISFTGCPYVYEATMCELDPEEDNYEDYIQLDKTRIALHVADQDFGRQDVFGVMEPDFMKTAQPAIEFVLNRIPFLMYNGNWDIICNHPGILRMFENMRETGVWEDIEDYYETADREVMDGEGRDVAGYLKSVGNLRMYVMRNAGHMVPRSQPEYAFDMFSDFLDGRL